MIIKNCRVCDNSRISTVIDLGNQPLANNLEENLKKKSKIYPLKVKFCNICCNCQLSIAVDHNILFKKYFYKTSTSASLVSHFDKASKKYLKKKIINKNSKVVDIGSNDASFLKSCKKIGIKNLIGIEPAKNFKPIYKKEKIKMINSFLNYSAAKDLKNSVNLITASNVFAHLDNINQMAKYMSYMLKQKGVIVVEVQYLPKMITDLIFDNIYHEHVNYWSLISLNYFFNKFNLKVFDYENINTHGGSIRVYISKDKEKKITKRFLAGIKKEKELKVNKKKFYLKFNNLVESKKTKAKNFFSKLKNKKIVGYGAPAKATVTLNYYNISKYFSYIIDENKLKKNKFIPGTKIQIKDKFLKKEETTVVMAWNYFNEIKKKIKNNTRKILNIRNL